MPRIKILSRSVANKIAAGEVVERPASVVKELMENSLDAGAGRIAVEISDGGRKLISVADNGCGMSRDDALMCLEAQATSKISDVDDIEKIATYGFRGEAIPSIAAVSRMTIKTCAKEEAEGTEISILGGEIGGIDSIGFPHGTTFEIRDLFFNVPARRKFMRAIATEQAHVRTTFVLQALSHPEVAMTLRIDGRSAYVLAAGSTLRDRITELFGADFMEGMREVDFSAFGVRVHGYVGLPNFTRADVSEQYIFVNNRAASAPVVQFALKEAYPNLERGRKPIVIIFVDLAPEGVDVNVHPTKREVRFRDTSAVRSAIIEAITRALSGESPRQVEERSGGEPIVSWDEIRRPPMPRSFPEPVSLAEIFRDNPEQTTFRFPASPPRVTPPTFEQTSDSSAPQSDGDLPPTLPATLSAPVGKVLRASSPNAPWEWVRIITVLQKSYVLLETDKGFAVLEPRAAHERVLYEHMLAVARCEKPVTQPLLIPETVRLPPSDADSLARNLSTLKKMGFTLEPFGDNSFIVRELPAELPKLDCRILLADLAAGINASGVKHSADKWDERAIALAASRAAVRNEGDLPTEALERLVADIAAAKMPYTCPRGRPTMIFTPFSDLARRFGRN